MCFDVLISNEIPLYLTTELDYTEKIWQKKYPAFSGSLHSSCWKPIVQVVDLILTHKMFYNVEQHTYQQHTKPTWNSLNLHPHRRGFIRSDSTPWIFGSALRTFLNKQLILFLKMHTTVVLLFLCVIVSHRQSWQSWQSCAWSPWGKEWLGVPSALSSGTLQTGPLSSLHPEVPHLSKKSVLPQS